MPLEVRFLRPLALFFLCCKRGGVKAEDSHVLAATCNLEDKYIIGRRAHGVVYKASLAPGEEHASEEYFSSF